MNNKNLRLKDLNVTEELNFIKNYYKFLLKYCQDYNLKYDGKIAVEIIYLIEDIERILSQPDEVIKASDIKLLIKIAEGRLFLRLNELSLEYNRSNTHDILRVPRYKLYYTLERHGY
ncbi:MAG: hypothetical protein E7Z86_01935 [Methanosphaera stadtmanae]|jgi:hypothetical protein|nr:hypothetical protein [Methanosphaera stadtmanae]